MPGIAALRLLAAGITLAQPETQEALEEPQEPDRLFDSENLGDTPEDQDEQAQALQVHEEKEGPGWIPRLSFEAYQNRILIHARRGMPIKTCMALVGLHPRLYNEWRVLADNGDRRYIKFFNLFDQARERGKARHIKEIQACGRGALDRDGIHRRDWRASAWLLERMHPEEYGRIDRLQTEVKAQVQMMPAIDPRKLSDQEIEHLKGLLLKSAGSTTIDTEAHETGE